MSGNQNLKHWKPGQSGNPKGKPKGTKHLSTWIREMLSDDNYTVTLKEGLKIKSYKGAPIKAIIAAQIHLAVNGNQKAFEVLAKYGYGSKLDISNTDGTMPVPILGGLSREQNAFMQNAKDSKITYNL